MKTIETTGLVTTAGYVYTQAPTDLPPGRYRVVLVVDETPAPAEDRTPLVLPVHDVGPWPEGLSLRREDMYGDDGR
ncbi:MAG TPA: hypothetical protein VMS17_27150 [Gemmataceae bacterium]|nr:hypothetical protein [Gemmataceae bacterium]